jgi:nucleoside permease NupC
VAPERSTDITRLALRAMLGGLLATCLLASVIGILV